MTGVGINVEVTNAEEVKERSRTGDIRTEMEVWRMDDVRVGGGRADEVVGHVDKKGQDRAVGYSRSRTSRTRLGTEEGMCYVCVYG